jgi:hypothetical protein
VPSCARLKSSPIALDSAPSRKGLWCRCVSHRFQARSRCRTSLALGTPPDWKGLRCHHVSRGSRPAPGAGGFWLRHVRSGPSPGREGLWCRHVSRSSRPVSQCRRALALPHAVGPIGREGLWCHHVSHGSRPTSRCRRALVSPRAAGPAAR